VMKRKGEENNPENNDFIFIIFYFFLTSVTFKTNGPVVELSLVADR